MPPPPPLRPPSAETDTEDDDYPPMPPPPPMRHRPEPRGAGRPVGHRVDENATKKKLILHKWRGDDAVVVPFSDTNIAHSAYADEYEMWRYPNVHSRRFHMRLGASRYSAPKDEPVPQNLIDVDARPLVASEHSPTRRRASSAEPASSHTPPTPRLSNTAAALSSSRTIMRRRRYPKLLEIDERGIPVPARIRPTPRQPRSMEEPYLRVSRAGAGVGVSAGGGVMPPKRGRPRGQRRLRGTVKEIAHAELERVQATANARMHIKMNLRGRRKLENWLADANELEKAALDYAVPLLAVDMRLLDSDAVVRRAAIGNMPNADLRIVEALKLRCETKEGHAVWAYMTGTDIQDEEPSKSDAPSPSSAAPAPYAPPLAPPPREDGSNK